MSEEWRVIGFKYKRLGRSKTIAVWVLLGTQYWSQCESEREDCFGPKEGEIWVFDKGLFEVKDRGCMVPAGDAIWVPLCV